MFLQAMDPGIIGVHLLSDVTGSQASNLGILHGIDPRVTTLKDLRVSLSNQLLSCPTNYCFCTKEGWIISEAQETNMCVAQLLNQNNEINLKIKYDLPKVGIRNRQHVMIGFVHASFTSKLSGLRSLIEQQILFFNKPAVTFQFLDGNLWPISLLQEDHMIIADILIGHCVTTNLHMIIQSPQISPTKEPPFKRMKINPQLSFRSSKDLSRPSTLPTDMTDGQLEPKQVLISYVRSEAASHALRLKEWLSKKGLSVYLDVHEIQTGVDWQDSLNFAVSGCEVFVPLVTKTYGETQWTNREIKLADVLGKYILPVSFLKEWPPRCLAIQFATTQFIPWRPMDQNPDNSADDILNWKTEDVKLVSEKIANRVRKLVNSQTPSLLKRGTVVKSCACVEEDNLMATINDREGKPLVMICLHPDQVSFAEELQSLLERSGLEVWCTTQLDKAHLEYIDSLANSQEGITYSILNKSDCKSHLSASEKDRDLKKEERDLKNKDWDLKKEERDLTNDHMDLKKDHRDLKKDLRDRKKEDMDLKNEERNRKNICKFQEMADEASVVLFILSEVFADSRVCQQQVFYCEHRKRVIPILYEGFTMPDWMAMLVGSHRLERRQDEDFQEVLVQRIKSSVDPALRLKQSKSVGFTPSPSEFQMFQSNRSLSNSWGSPWTFPIKVPSLRRQSSLKEQSFENGTSIMPDDVIVYGKPGSNNSSKSDERSENGESVKYSTGITPTLENGISARPEEVIVYGKPGYYNNSKSGFEGDLLEGHGETSANGEAETNHENGLIALSERENLYGKHSSYNKSKISIDVNVLESQRQPSENGEAVNNSSGITNAGVNGESKSKETDEAVLQNGQTALHASPKQLKPNLVTAQTIIL